MFVRDSSKNIARVAFVGDSRIMTLGLPREAGLEADQIWEKVEEGCYLTYPHDVFNVAELHRLRESPSHCFEIDGPYLINPLTGCEIQPTRGFGDFDMYGTGYISTPEVSSAFEMVTGSCVLIGSDGIFDEKVWKSWAEPLT